MCDDVLLYDPKATISGVILQAMAPKGKEVMIGAKQDPTFGPCIIVGTGGIYTEVLNDYTFRLAPLNEFEARKMLAELKLYPLLEGVRGEAPCEIDSIVDTVLRVSQLVSTHLAIKEIDINPLIVNEQGSIIVDARIIT